MYLQVVINISFQVVLTFVLYWYLFKLLFTSFTSTRCRLFTSTRCLCVTICLQVVTRVYKLLQVHVSTRLEMT